MSEARPRDDRARLAELAQMVVREPRSIPYRLDLAMALLAAERREDAIRLFRDVALTYAEGGQLIQAMAVCRGILEIDTAHEETLALLASFVERGDGQTVPQIGDEEEDGPTHSEPPSFDEKEDDTNVDIKPKGWAAAPRVATPITEERPAIFDSEDPEEPTSPGASPGMTQDLEAHPSDDIVAEALMRSAVRDEVGALPAFPLLSDLPREAFVELLREVSVIERGANEILLEEGSPGDAFYLVADGSVRVKKGDIELALLGPGSFFGEFAVFSDQRRHATVESIGPVRLLEVTRALLDRLIADHPGVARILRAFYGDRLLATLVQTAPFFSALSPEERADITTRFRPRRFGRGATIIEEGASGGGLYLILVGEVEVVRNDAAGQVELGKIGEGSYFGEMSLLKGANASATVRATRLCETVQLSPREFYEIVSRHPVLWDQLRVEAQQRELTNVAILAGVARGHHDDGVYLV